MRLFRRKADALCLFVLRLEVHHLRARRDGRAERESEEGPNMYRASIENRGDTKYHATTRSGALALGTAGEAPNPVDALLASLGACVGHYVRDYLRGEGIAYRGFIVDAEAAATPDQRKLASITLWIDLGDTELAPQQRAALLAFVERCKVHGTLRESCPIETRWGRSTQAMPRAAQAAAGG